LPESDESYLHYCEANCDWTDVNYSLKTIQQKQDALAKLMSSDKWKQTVVARMPGGKDLLDGKSQLFDFIGGKGGTRTLDPGIMRTMPGKKAQ
jgi:hypothetical protein